jgi:cellulose synthase/poly-beta-1,6-N-acetylglucosamine synthase-like glycosyltransferase
VVLHRPATVAEARQLGAEAASTRWLLFTDADVRFAPDYFARLAGLGGDAGAIYGAKRSSGDFANYYAWFVWGQRLLHGMGVAAASGSNMLVRSDAFAAAGGFDLSLSCNEDSELVWRVKRAGYPVDFVPELSVYETDHRRLRLGVVRKTGHSLIRCAMLYLNLMPSRWRKGDWSYWAGLPNRGAAQTQDSGK